MEMQVIYNQNVLGKEFKVYGTNEEPLFLAKDVAEWIEHSRASEMLKSIDEDEKLMQTILASGQNRQMWFLTEDGLYEVLMQSRKPIAKAFKKEVKQILKQIRLTGGAVVEDREEEFINNYFPSFSDEVKLAMVQDLRQKNQQLKLENENLNQKIELDAPKVEAFDTFLDSDGLCSVTEVCRSLNLKRADVFATLRANGYVCKRSPLPTKKAIDKGIFVEKITNGGHHTLKVTALGVEFIRRNFKSFIQDTI